MIKAHNKDKKSTLYLAAESNHPEIVKVASLWLLFIRGEREREREREREYGYRYSMHKLTFVAIGNLANR